MRRSGICARAKKSKCDGVSRINGVVRVTTIYNYTCPICDEVGYLCAIIARGTNIYRDNNKYFKMEDKIEICRNMVRKF